MAGDLIPHAFRVKRTWRQQKHTFDQAYRFGLKRSITGGDLIAWSATPVTMASNKNRTRKCLRKAQAEAAKAKSVAEAKTFGEAEADINEVAESKLAGTMDPREVFATFTASCLKRAKDIQDFIARRKSFNLHFKESLLKLGEKRKVLKQQFACMKETWNSLLQCIQLYAIDVDITMMLSLMS